MMTNSPSEPAPSPQQPPAEAATQQANNTAKLGLPRERRLRRAADFQRVYQRRCRASDPYLLAYGCESHLPYPRLGLAVSRRVGKAVLRNRWKRRLREAFRRQAHALPAGLDLILVPHATSLPSLHVLSQSLRRLAFRLAKRLADEADAREEA